MSFKNIQKIPDANEILAEMPLSAELQKMKARRDAVLKDIITGKSHKFLVIIGPCSADNEEAVCEYVQRLAKLQEKVAEKDRLGAADLYEQTPDDRRGV